MDRITVSVVEDNKKYAATLARILTAAPDLAVLGVAPSAEEFLKQPALRKADVAILDIGLPGFDGLEVARRLRADPALKGVFLVALSGWAQPEDLARSREAGFDHHLAKPVPLRSLELVLLEAPGRRRRTA